MRHTRRHFLATAGAAAAATALPPARARAAARYTRHNVTSPNGQKALTSYARGIAAMLQLPADHPHNWFRNAFIHLMDCPHGNWWSYVWHRGYIGYLERTIRALSGDANFALPYWDWTQLPRIPDRMFNAVLTPTSKAYAPFTANLAKFTAFIKAPLASHWNGLDAAQRAQLDARGYTGFDALWNDVTGYDPDPKVQAGIAGNEAFASTGSARYLTRDNPAFDAKTAYDCAPLVIYGGLLPTAFNHPDAYQSFTSAKTASHNAPPGSYSVLEGLPHNNVHACIAGVGPIDPGPYGNMSNNLSPIDPIFFLHHANMDRLWDVWTRKQQALKLPHLPTGADLKTFTEEPFLFYVDEAGKPVGPSSKAGDYVSTAAFDYAYEPGFGEDFVQPASATVAADKGPLAPPLAGTMQGDVGSVTVSRAAVESHLAPGLQHRALVAQVTLPHPGGLTTARTFDVLVNAPLGVTSAAPDAPYYAGTIAFFGAMMPGMHMNTDTTFAVPLPRALPAFTRGIGPSATLDIRIAPSGGRGGPTPPLRAVAVGAL